MKRFFTMLLAAVALALPAWAADYNHPYVDGLSGTVTVDTEGVVYYDYGGPTGAAHASNTGYVLFKSDDASSPLTITFEELDLDASKASLYIYEGDCKQGGWKKGVPEGYVAKLDGNEAGYSFTTTGPELSVLYYCEVFSSPGAGWKATVKAGTPKDMEFESAELTTPEAGLWRGEKDALLATVSITNTGTLNPLALDNLTFDLADIAASGLVRNLRVYNTSVSDANLAATLTEGATSLTVKADALKGRNSYIVVADVCEDATGTLPAAAVSTLTVGGEAREIALSASPLEVANFMLMPVGDVHTTYTISTAAGFYDAGGKDGNVPPESKGTITFVPATEGSIIRLDPREWALFNTSSIGKNDQFRVYAGREVNDENLIAELLNTPRIINSTAADGSLTIYFESLNGNASGAKKGWDIEVSEIVPSNMTLGDIAPVEFTAPAIAAGSAKERVLLFNLPTTNTLAPLSLGELDFSVGAEVPAGAITALEVCYLGDDPSNSVSSVFGQAVPAADGAVKVIGTQKLAEGNNYFAVAISVAENALNGNTLAIELKKAILGELAKDVAGVAVSATVDNVCRSTEGSHSHTIYGEWLFTHTPVESSYSTKYEAGDVDQIVTFIPSDPAAKAQLKFSDFDLAYSSSTYYGARAKFEVYSGSTAEGEPIWKLSSAADATKGPGRTLRSAAADGALTVVFNPNTTVSSYTANGWHAEVKPFTDHAATVTDIKVSQKSTDILGPGTSDAELIAFDAQVEGTLSPITLQEVKLSLRGASQLAKVKVYSTTDGTFANATLWGEAEVDTDSSEPATVAIAPAATELAPLAEESNRFLVAVDAKSSIASDVEVDAALLSLGFGGDKTAVPSDGDPAGVRLTKNIYILTDEPQQTVVVGSSINFYDNGGPDGKVTPVEAVVTFVPADPASLLTLSTNSFSIGGGKIFVYSGREVNDAAILGKTTGYFTMNGPDNLVSKADDGSLTLKIKLIGTTLDGFDLSVTSVKSEAHRIASVSAENYSEFAATRGGSDLAIGSVKLDVEGNKGKVAISSVKASVAGSTNPADVKQLGLYFSEDGKEFSPTMIVAEKQTPAADGTVEFTLADPVTIDLKGAYRLWFAADIAAAANPGNTVEVALTGITANDTEVEIPADTKVSREVKAGLAGNFRVGASETADYPTIADAVDALKGGMEGSVMFLLEDGVYNEDILVKDVQGTSADNLLIFTSASGKRDNVTIAGGKRYASDKDNMVAVVNTPYVVFRNLTFRPESTGYGTVIDYRWSSRYGTVDNCVVEAPVVENGSYSGTVPVKVENASSSGDIADNADTECDYFTIRDSRLLNGYIGLSLNTRGYTTDRHATGIRVLNNTIEGYASKGIYVNTLADFEISGNTITKSGINKSNIYGMDVYNAQGSFAIEGNKITQDLVSGVGASISTTALYMRAAWDHSGSKDAANPARVVNNVIAVNGSVNYTTYGLQLQKKYENILIAHNTIVVATPGTQRAGYPLGLLSPELKENTGLQVRNNILQALSGSPENSSSPLNVWDDSDYANIAFSGNVLYSNSGFVDNQSTKHDLAAYSELTGDLTSVFAKAEFYSDNDLHLLSSEGMMMEPVETVAADADGLSRRNPTAAGAYEYVDVNTETPVLAEGYPRLGALTDASATFTTSWSVGGDLYAMALPADQEAPSAERLMEQRPVAAAADTEVAYTISFLDQQTTYKAYFMVVTPVAKSEIAVSEEFTTPKKVEELTVEIGWDEEALREGDMMLLEAAAAGGEEPYSYSWTNAAGETVGTEEILSAEVTMPDSYRVTVTSADGQTATAKANVDVYTEALKVADFENLLLPAESNWKYDELNPDDTYTDAFYSGSFRFPNYPWMEYQSWSGFGFANETSTEFRDWNDQFRNAQGGGAANSATYGVAYMMGADMRLNLLTDPAGEGWQIPGVYLVNSAYTLNSILNGDGYCRKFDAEHGDFFTVTIEGLDADGNSTGKVEANLADFRSGAAAAAAEEETAGAPVIVDKWTWYDLSTLGPVHTLRFGYMSSQQSQVPAYVCFDNLGANSPSSSEVRIALEGALSLAYRNGLLSAYGVEGDAEVAVYSADGVMRLKTRLTASGNVAVDMLPSGVYIARLSAEGCAPAQLRFVKR